MLQGGRGYRSPLRHVDDPITFQTTPGAGPWEWAGLAVLALPTLVLALDMSVLYLAAPA